MESEPKYIIILFDEDMSTNDKALAELDSKITFDLPKDREWGDLVQLRKSSNHKELVRMSKFAVSVGSVQRDVDEAKAIKKIKDKFGGNKSKCKILEYEGWDVMGHLASLGWELVTD